MLARLQPHLSFANVVSLMALFIALSASSYAVVNINGKNIENRTIAGKKLKNRTITRGTVKKNTLTGTEIAESRLRKVPSAARADSAAAADSAKAADAATSAAAADRLDGLDSTDFLQVGSGRTIRGLLHIEEDGGTPLGETLGSFPIVADLADDQVNFAPSPLADDGDASCTGTAENPTAPRGKVCLYLSGSSGNIAHAVAEPFTSNTPFLSIRVQVQQDHASVPYLADIAWAYTVP